MAKQICPECGAVVGKADISFNGYGECPGCQRTLRLAQPYFSLLSISTMVGLGFVLYWLGARGLGLMTVLLVAFIPIEAGVLAMARRIFSIPLAAEEGPWSFRFDAKSGDAKRQSDQNPSR